MNQSYAEAKDVLQEQIQAAADVLRTSQHLVVLTGAGISKESGIPTLVARPHTAATPDAFRRKPKLVWDWYRYRRGLVAQAKPNPGHLALAALERYLPQVVVITQNIDGLHNQAGSSNVIPIHGDIRLNKCFADCQGDPTLVDISTLSWDEEAGPPRCPYCGAYVRPAVVWFYEEMPLDLMDQADDLARAADVMLVVGTSGVVEPAAGLPRIAHHCGATIIEVNVEETEHTGLAKWFLKGPAGVVLPQLVAALAERAKE